MKTKTPRKLTKTAKVAKPLKWHGGKHYLAKRIIELMPPHLHYVEPYWGVVDGLPSASERLREVVILDSQDALKVIKQQDGENTLFYLDPPYLHQTRVTTDDYEYEMTATQHSKLLKALGRIKGSFILSGYRSAMYDGKAKLFGWRREDIEIDNKASSKSTKDKAVECLWMNY